MVEIIWTESAIQDLNDIGDYIARNSIRYAEITVNELFESTGILANHPRAGVAVPEFENDLIRQIVRGNYRIVYQIVDDVRIEILTIHNCARLISNTEPFKSEEGKERT